MFCRVHSFLIMDGKAANSNPEGDTIVEYSEFKRSLKLETYKKIVKYLMLQRGLHVNFDIGESEKDIFGFFNKYKRNFYINKNTKKPKYQLEFNGNDLCRYPNGIPKLVVNVYHRPTSTDNYKYLVPLEMVKSVLDSIHCVSEGENTTCHPTNRVKLIEQFNQQHHFYGIRNQVEDYLENCITCKLHARLDTAHPPPPIPIRSFYPHQRLQFDLIIMSSKKKNYFSENRWGFKVVMSIKCCFSKYVWLFPLKNKSAVCVFDALKYLFLAEGFPMYFQSDNGGEFVAEIITKFLKENNVIIKHGRPRHPQSQGQVENLNKLVKSHLSRLLYNKPPKIQGQIWPLLLPSIAGVINNTYHHAIDDVPFRVYKNRNPSQLKKVIIPDDLSIYLQTKSKRKEDANEPEETLSDSEDDSSEETHEDTDEMDHDFIYQSCASSQLMFDLSFDDTKQSVAPNSVNTENEEESPVVSTDVFNNSLYLLGKNKDFLSLKTLEATEYAVQKNLTRCRKVFESIPYFKLGQKVLIKNPKFNLLSFSQKNYTSRNLIGIIKDITQDTCLVEINDGSQVYAKNIFKGQIIPFGNDSNVGEEDENSNQENEFDLKHFYDALSNYGASIRQRFYDSKQHFRYKQPIDIKNDLQKYYLALDKGFLGTFFKNIDVTLSQEYLSSHNTIIEYLLARKFCCFLYGTIVWENTRKNILPETYLEIIKKYFPTFMDDHECVACFDSDNCCNHLCCITKAKSFAERVGLHLTTKSNRKIVKADKVRKELKNDVNKNSSKSVPKKMVEVDQTRQDNALLLPRHIQFSVTKMLSVYPDETSKKNASLLVKKIQSCLKKGSPYSNGFNEVLRYLTSVVGKSDIPTDMIVKKFQAGAISIYVHCQQSSNICGICALNNVLLAGPNLTFLPNDANLIADKAWLNATANIFEIDEPIPPMRSRFGDYNISVLQQLCAEKGFTWTHFDQQIRELFSKRERMSGVAIYNEIRNILNCSKVFLSTGKNHFLALLLLENNVVTIDSLKPYLNIYDVGEAVNYIASCVNLTDFSIVVIEKNIGQSQSDIDMTIESTQSVPPGPQNMPSVVFKDDFFNSFDVKKSYFDGTTKLDKINIDVEMINYFAQHLMNLCTDIQIFESIIIQNFIVADILRVSKVQQEKNVLYFPLFDNKEKYWHLLMVLRDQNSFQVYKTANTEFPGSIFERIHHVVFKANSNSTSYKKVSCCEMLLVDCENSKCSSGVFVLAKLFSLSANQFSSFTMLDVGEIRENLIRMMKYPDLIATMFQEKSLLNDTVTEFDATENNPTCTTLQHDAQRLHERFVGVEDIILLLKTNKTEDFIEYIETCHNRKVPSSNYHYLVDRLTIKEYDKWSKEKLCYYRGRFSRRKLSRLFRLWAVENRYVEDLLSYDIVNEWIYISGGYEAMFLRWKEHLPARFEDSDIENEERYNL